MKHNIHDIAYHRANLVITPQLYAEIVRTMRTITENYSPSDARIKLMDTLRRALNQLYELDAIQK